MVRYLLGYYSRASRSLKMPFSYENYMQCNDLRESDVQARFHENTPLRLMSMKRLIRETFHENEFRRFLKNT